MATGLLGIALTGLNAAQAGISTAQHNIANINTPGFRRQEVDYAALNPQFNGTTFFGSGVGVSTVRSLYSQFQDSQVLLNQAQLSHNESYATQASQIDQLVGNANSGLTSAMDAFFGAIQTVAADPTSNAARQVMLSSGRNLASRINTLDTAFKNIRDASNSEIDATVTRINIYASQIAATSGNIARTEASTGQPANDLRDQRDQLVAELNKLINVTPVQQGDGAYNLFVGSGQSLVVGSNVSTMTSIDDATNPLFLVPALNIAGGGTQPLDSSMLRGGKLGGLLAVREDVLLPAMDDLNRIAISISTEVNAVHQNGLELDAVTSGGEFFTPAMEQQGGAIGWLRVGESTSGTTIPAEDYNVVWDGTNFTVTRLSDGAASAPILPGSEVTIGGVAQGFSLSPNLNFVPNTGTGSWKLNFSDFSRSMRMVLTAPSQIAAAGASANSGPGDNSNALLLAGLQTSENIGTNTFAGFYAQLVARTATMASEADINVAAYETLTSQSRVAQQAVSGVNLDEEAANLIRFQQAYQASAKAMQVASSLFDELIGILR